MAPENFHTGNYPAGPAPNNQTSYALAPGSAVAMGAVGALIGAVSATATSLQQVKDQEVSKQEAALVVAKEAAGTGLATAAGGAAARALGMRGFVGLLGMFAVATGVKYFWNQAMDSRPQAAPEPTPASDEPVEAVEG